MLFEQFVKVKTYKKDTSCLHKSYKLETKARYIVNTNVSSCVLSLIYKNNQGGIKNW